MSIAQRIDSLSYEPTIVRIQGIIRQDTFPGPPNYESIKNGDKMEVYWILDLVSPVFVNGTPGDDINKAESNVTKMQLVLLPKQYLSYKNLIRHKVIVTGTLFHGITGHHKTDVLVKVKNITAG
jgi:hypothetical protein